MVQASRGSSWSPLDISLFTLMIAVWAWMFRSPLRDILELAWKDEEHSHILLVPLVIAWLLWLRRSRLSTLRVRPSLFGCAVVAIACVASWWGFQNDRDILWHGGAVLALLGMVLTMTGGIVVIRRFAPVVLAMAFLLPVPGTIRQGIAIPLQGIATSVTHQCLGIFGYESARMGNVLLINGQQVAVAEACNGMRLVFALSLVVYAFVFSTPLRPATRVILLALTPLVALIANVIRLVPTSLMYGAVSVDAAELVHDVSGWVMLPIALAGMIGLLKLLRWMELPVMSYRLANQ